MGRVYSGHPANARYLIEVRIAMARFKYTWPLLFALALLLLGNISQTLGFSLPSNPELVGLLLSPGNIDPVARILTALFVLFVLCVVHMDTNRKSDALDRLLARHLPALLWGFGLACFLVAASVGLAALFGLSGLLLARSEKYSDK